MTESQESTPMPEGAGTEWMQAVRVHHFGGLDAMVYESVPRPQPGEGQVLIRVRAAGVGPWDALVRSGNSGLTQPLPLTLGSDLSGVIEEAGAGVSAFQPGEAVFGVTNAQFTGAYAEYAVAEAARIARKPEVLTYIEAASVPVITVTAWQMAFDYGQADRSKRVLVQGAGGNVGAYAVQLLKRIGAYVVATAFPASVDYVTSLGADQVIAAPAPHLAELARDMDIVLDLVGGETLDRSFDSLKPGGVLISSVAQPDPEKAAKRGVRGLFFIVDVTAERLNRIAAMFQAGELHTHIGEVLPLAQARLAHEMLAGKPHKPGKIVLAVDP
jgi:NADPH:quinone reductase-like Zn-dependent oxidoreductase